MINGLGALLLAVIGWKLFFSAIGIVPLVFLLPWLLFLRKWERPSIGKSEASLAEGFALMKQRTVLGFSGLLRLRLRLVPVSDMASSLLEDCAAMHDD